ncbi:hypothetical protein ACJX0J_011729, partial [Zea mays]
MPISIQKERASQVYEISSQAVIFVIRYKNGDTSYSIKYYKMKYLQLTRIKNYWASLKSMH